MFSCRSKKNNQYYFVKKKKQKKKQQQKKTTKTILLKLCIRTDMPKQTHDTAVVRASLGSHVGKPDSAYGLSGGFSPGSPVFAHL